MKRLLLISAVCGGLVFTGHGQPIRVWIEQLAALKGLEQSVQQGYRGITYGLESIGNSQQQEYALHSNYISGLDNVSPAIEQDQRVIALRQLQARMLQQISDALEYWRKQPFIQP